ncbi:MAG: succinylglutamate desuccinylase/aspartoacylase family protein [Candidatus Thiodiazotropha sp. (ex Epidulcina cf. delphinae)]|nr:succinylglutamate desuccinylase/aspartoacylase family protein [Candidatus Thiodiazotropha sp. (ex Epidulcina cf. delphinae)]
MLQEIDYLPQNLLSLEADQLVDALSGPTLIHLPGRREEPVFVSVLMHGNESVGWEAIRRLLARYQGGEELPRALSLFIGNVQAAARGLRLLPGQPDFNRVWRGSELAETPEHRLMGQVVERMRPRKPFASVDVHNNTGLNPHYACVNRLDTPFLHLALLFSRTVVYFLRPRGVQSMAFAELCPSVTLECGKVGSAHGVEHALDYLNACLHLAEHPQHPVSHLDIDLFHTVAQVKISPDVSFGFSPGESDIVLAPDIDHMNFRELPAGTPIGWTNGSNLDLLDVRDEKGEEVGRDYFVIEQDRLCLNRAVMPSMLTKDLDVIHQDCLCYLMERYVSHLEKPPQG